jgi:hypothetical protein
VGKTQGGYFPFYTVGYYRLAEIYLNNYTVRLYAALNISAVITKITNKMRDTKLNLRMTTVDVAKLGFRNKRGAKM